MARVNFSTETWLALVGGRSGGRRLLSVPPVRLAACRAGHGKPRNTGYWADSWLQALPLVPWSQS